MIGFDDFGFLIWGCYGNVFCILDFDLVMVGSCFGWYVVMGGVGLWLGLSVSCFGIFVVGLFWMGAVWGCLCLGVVLFWCVGLWLCWSWVGSVMRCLLWYVCSDWLMVIDVFFFFWLCFLVCGVVDVCFGVFSVVFLVVRWFFFSVKCG